VISLSSALHPLRVTVSILITGLLAGASAQASELFDEADLLSDIPYVASATRLAQKITEAPASITRIDREMIKASGAVTIPDLFRLVPGMQAYSVTRNRYAVTYHGMSGPFPNRLEVMINGRSIYLPVLFTVDWHTLGVTLDDISYIEVVRGSNVPTYGSNALLGAINIVTHTPLETPHNQFRIHTGPNQSREAQFQAHGNHENHLSLHASGGYSSNAGSARFEDGFSNRYLNLSGIYTPDLFNTLDMQLTFTDGHSWIGQADGANNTFSRRLHNANTQHIRWQHLMAEDSELQLSFYHNRNSMRAPLLPVEELVALQQEVSVEQARLALQFDPRLQPLLGTELYQDNEHGTTNLYDLELSLSHYPSDALSFVWGGAYRFEQAQSDTLLQEQGLIDEHHRRLFGNVQWRLSDHWTLNTGLMAERSSLLDETQLSPRLALNYHWDDYLTLRTALTRAHRIPSLLERHAAFAVRDNQGEIWDLITRPAADLGSEDVNSAEVGLLKLWPDSHAQLDLRLFYEDVDNAIDTFFIPLEAGSDFDNRVRELRNIGHWTNRGLDLGWQWKPGGNRLLMLSYSYLSQHGMRDRGQRSADLPPELDSLSNRSPRHTLAVLASASPYPGWQLGISHYLMSGAAWLEGASFQKPRKTYNRTDLNLSTDIPLSQQQTLGLTLTIQNLFNRTYSEFYEFNEVDRRVYLGAEIRF